MDWKWAERGRRERKRLEAEWALHRPFMPAELWVGSEMQRALAYSITERNITNREEKFPEGLTENMQLPTTTYEGIY